MSYRNKLIILAILVMLVAAMQYILPDNPHMVNVYNAYIFRPYQSFRNMLLGKIPISVGDILYLVLGVLVLLTIVRWFYFVFKFRTHKHYLGHLYIRCMISLCIAYVLFFVGWGGNYYKPSLAEYWNLQVPKPSAQTDTLLIAYDHLLINKLNEYAAHYRDLSFRQTDRRAQSYYKAFTDSKTRLHGLNAKPSIFGYMMQYFEIQGYYNPFTGEAQVNRYLPSFMLPFVVCHEMAHQSGIAAEGDANLLSYVVCTAVKKDTAFGYSAYFNLWLYAHSRLRAWDSTVANTLKKQLNQLSLAHLDTLRAIRKRYRSEVSDYSGWLYDGYLRLHNQKEGIASYSTVVMSAWAWDEQQKWRTDWMIRIP